MTVNSNPSMQQGVSASPLAARGYRNLLRDDFEDQEPRIHDLELAKLLGYARLRDVRHVIERLRADGFLRGCVMTATPPSCSGGRPGVEYWLDERSTLFVIAKSGTEVAYQIFGEVVETFMSAARRKLAN